MNLMSLLSSPIGQSIVENISGKLNLDTNQATNAIGESVPVILEGLSKNAETEEGAKGIDKALEKHNGGLLDNLTGMLQNGGEEVEKEGSGILNHIFGSNLGAVQNSLSEKTGLGTDKIAPLLSTLAPVVMSFLGKEKQNQNIGSNGIGGLLSGMLGGKSSGILGMVEGFLDKDGDGSAIDDVMGMFK